MILLFCALCVARRWMSDDGFIYLRVVENLLSGNGPVFNLSERVEAYTSPMWVLILSGLATIGIRLEFAAVFGGIALSVAGMAAALFGSASIWRARRRSGERKGTLVPLGAMAYAVVPAAWDHASAGLETGLVMFWLGLVFLLFSRIAVAASVGAPGPRGCADTSRWKWFVLAFVGGLGPLVRPELSLFVLTMSVGALAILIDSIGRRRALLMAIPLFLSMMLVPIAYQVFRMGYFAALTANTAVAKSVFDPWWNQGGLYLWNTLGTYHLYVPLALSAVLFFTALRRLTRERNLPLATSLLGPLAGGLLLGLYVVAMGGGFMHGRMLLPPLFAFLMPLFVIEVGPLEGRRHLVGVVASIAVFSIWVILCLAVFRVARENAHGIGDERGWYSREAGVENPVAIEDYRDFRYHEWASEARAFMERSCDGPDDGRGGTSGCERFVYVDRNGLGKLTIGKGKYAIDPSAVDDDVRWVLLRCAIGISGYLLGPSVHMADHHGLSDPVAARLEMGSRGRPGHEKKLHNHWVVARFARPKRPSDPAVAKAREALGCGKLRDLIRAVTAPMTAELFLENISNAYEFQTLSIPLDPGEARELFCEEK